MSVNSQIERLSEFLVNGGNVTAGQAKSRFGVTSMAKAVRAMRAEGYAVYENLTTTKSGSPIRLFRVGTPTRRVVAAGHKALGLA